MTEQVTQAVNEAFSRSAAFVQDNKTVSVVAGATAAAGIAYLWQRSYNRRMRKPSGFEISGGSLARDKVKDEVYCASSLLYRSSVNFLYQITDCFQSHLPLRCAQYILSLAAGERVL